VDIGRGLKCQNFVDVFMDGLQADMAANGETSDLLRILQKNIMLNI